MKKATFNRRTFLKKSKLYLTFFLLVSRFISVMTDKLSQHIAVSYILLKKDSGGDLKLKLVTSHILFYSQFPKTTRERRLFFCNLQKLNHSLNKGRFCAKLKPRATCFIILTSAIEISVETYRKHKNFKQFQF